MPQSATRLCALDDIDNPGSAAFDVGDALSGVLGERWAGFEVFVVRQGEQLHGYINACPHTSGPLDWTPGQFLDAEKKRIQCSTHHALFKADDGLCIAGPCIGQSLVPVSLRVEAGAVWLEQA